MTLHEHLTSEIARVSAELASAEADLYAIARLLTAPDRVDTLRWLTDYSISWSAGSNRQIIYARSIGCVLR